MISDWVAIDEPKGKGCPITSHYDRLQLRACARARLLRPFDMTYESSALVAFGEATGTARANTTMYFVPASSCRPCVMYALGLAH
jgi:hypothetical protein